MRISDWSSDVCSSDLVAAEHHRGVAARPAEAARALRHGAGHEQVGLAVRQAGDLADDEPRRQQRPVDDPTGTGAAIATPPTSGGPVTPRDVAGDVHAQAAEGDALRPRPAQLRPATEDLPHTPLATML